MVSLLDSDSARDTNTRLALEKMGRAIARVADETARPTTHALSINRRSSTA